MRRFLWIVIPVFFFISCNKDRSNSPATPQDETILNVSYGTDSLQKMDVYLPGVRSADTTKAIIMIHGGAWTSGDKTDFTSYVPSIKKRLPAYAVFNVNYRLATTTGNSFPAQENDINNAVNFIISKASAYKISSSKIILLGASSGAQMALLQAYKYSTPKIKAVVDLFGPTDMIALYNNYTGFTQYALGLIVGGTPASNPTAYSQSSPLNYVSAQSPPTIIFHGGMDDVVPVVQSTNLKNKLQSFNISTRMFLYPNEGHGWFGAPLEDSFDKIAAFLLTNVQ
jgi:acetyl esterase/lipase